MWKRVIVLLSVLICCYCEEKNDILVEETRAKKKKGSAKLLSLILLLAFAKVAVFKVVSIFMLSMFFQKMLAAGGLLLNYFLQPKTPRIQSSYGPPEYNTLGYNTPGYSYGPPGDGEGDGPLTEPKLEWLFNKHVK